MTARTSKTAAARPAARPGKMSARAAVQALYETGACRASRCGNAAIRWVPTAKRHPVTGAHIGSGALVPLDHGRDPHGLVVVDYDKATDKALARPLDPRDSPDRPRYSLHWSTCHEPELWRQVRNLADPSGVFPGLPMRRSPHSGPCSVCQEVFDHKYGPGGSPLCLECARTAVARWSPAMLPTIRSWTPELRRLLLVEDLHDAE